MIQRPSDPQVLHGMISTYSILAKCKFKASLVKFVGIPMTRIYDQP